MTEITSRIHEGCIMLGSLFNEPMRLETIRQEPIKDPARFPWHEVTKVAHYWLEVNAMTRLMLVREDGASYGKEDQ